MNNKRILLVTGASSDVGCGMIRALAGRYDFIWAHYNSSGSLVERLRKELGNKIWGIQSDLSKEKDVHELIDTISKSGQYPDHIVHLAAPKSFNQKFHKCCWDDYDRGINISLRSIVLILEAFIPKMVKQRYGKIIFFLSSYVIGVPPKYQSPYITVKYALLGLMRNLAAEYADKRITVNAVSPEMIDTKFLDEIPDLVKQGNADKMPIGRNLMVDDIVGTLYYLLSDGADVVTGQNIGVTGGIEIAR